jgi:hypothetical protein
LDPVLPEEVVMVMFGVFLLLVGRGLSSPVPAKIPSLTRR